MKPLLDKTATHHLTATQPAKVPANLRSMPDKYAPPYYLTWIIFYCGIIFLSLRILDHIVKVVRGNSMTVKLTREVFSRISDNGETWFLNVVLIAHETSALVEGVKATLNKTDGATKQFTLELKMLGEKVKDSQVIANHSFYSTSPILSVQPNSPERLVYLMIVEEYRGRLNNAFTDFGLALERYFSERSKTFDGRDPNNQEIEEARNASQKIFGEYQRKIVSSIQIEPGKYEIEIEVTYSQKGVFFPFFTNRKANSKISFEISENTQEDLEIKIQDCLKTIMWNKVQNDNRNYQLPEISPRNVKEL